VNSQDYPRQVENITYLGYFLEANEGIAWPERIPHKSFTVALGDTASFRNLLPEEWGTRFELGTLKASGLSS
jgi:hypothetical protein